MAPQTRKNKTRSGGTTAGSSRRRRVVATTIPELKQSFDALERKVVEILRAGGDQKQRVRKFQEAWRSIFGRPVEASAAEAYLQVKARTLPKVGAKTRKSQRGGASALAGAPVDFQTRPGVDGVHGSFLPYLTKGLDFYNTINQHGMFKGCGTEDITPQVPASLGSNKVGGGLLSDAAFVATTRPVAASSPPSLFNDIQTAWQGRSLGASPAPDQNPLKYV